MAEHTNHGCGYLVGPGWYDEFLPTETKFPPDTMFFAKNHPQPLRSAQIVTDEQFNEIQRMTGQPERRIAIAVDGVGDDAVYVYHVQEKVPSGQYQTISIYTPPKPVQEDPEVQRLDYTEPAREELSAKLAELGKQRAELSAKTVKKQVKANDSQIKLNDLDRSIKRHEDLREKAALRLPKEPHRYGHLQVVTFEKTFGKRYGTGYQYAAIRPAGKTTWSVTGKTSLNGITWEQLVDFVISDEVSFTNRQQALDSLRVRG